MDKPKYVKGAKATFTVTIEIDGMDDVEEAKGRFENAMNQGSDMKEAFYHTGCKWSYIHPNPASAFRMDKWGTGGRPEWSGTLEGPGRTPTVKFHPEEWVRKIGLNLLGHWILEFQYDDGDNGAYEVIDLGESPEVIAPLLNMYGQLIGYYPPDYNPDDKASEVRRLVLRRKTKQEVYDYIKDDFSGEDLEDLQSFIGLD